MININNYKEYFYSYLDNFLFVIILYLIVQLLNYITYIVNFYENIYNNVIAVGVISLLTFIVVLFVGNLIIKVLIKNKINKNSYGKYLASKIMFYPLYHYIFWIGLLIFLFYFNIWDYFLLNYFSFNGIIFWFIIVNIIPFRKIKFYENGILMYGFPLYRFYNYNNKNIKIEKRKYFVKVSILNSSYYVLDINNNLIYNLKINNVIVN